MEENEQKQLAEARIVVGMVNDMVRALPERRVTITVRDMDGAEIGTQEFATRHWRFFAVEGCEDCPSAICAGRAIQSLALDAPALKKYNESCAAANSGAVAATHVVVDMIKAHQNDEPLPPFPAEMLASFGQSLLEVRLEREMLRIVTGCVSDPAWKSTLAMIDTMTAAAVVVRLAEEGARGDDNKPL